MIYSNMIKAAYIHIPFCRNICKYCDFSKMYINNDLINKYLISLEKEINKNYKKEVLKTIYIGGGTPSSLNIKQLKKLFSILKVLKKEKEYEFTFECNVEDINEELLILLKKNRVNRLSIGVQSFNKKVLNILGRNINCNYIKNIKLAKKYFSNISIDLIYGVNGQSLFNLKKDLKKIIKLGINHVSLYSLILEDNTILKINNYKELSDEKVYKMYNYINKILKKHRFTHYEISNYSKEGYSSIHNLTYWNNNQYYGFGLSASGFVNGYRYTNTRSINNYINGKYIKEKYKVSKREDMENFMILGLRKLKGVSSSEFKKRYNKDIDKVFDLKKLKYKNDMYYISEEDMYVSNSILVDFIN